MEPSNVYPGVKAPPPPAGRRSHHQGRPLAPKRITTTENFEVLLQQIGFTFAPGRGQTRGGRCASVYSIHWPGHALPPAAAGYI